MNKKILLLAGIVLLGVGGYGLYAWNQPDVVPETPSNWVVDQRALDELPNVAPQSTATVVPTPTGTTRPVTSPSVRPSSVITPRAPEKIVVPAETSTPGMTSTDPNIRLGKGYLSQGKYAEARDAFNQANQSDATTIYYQGLITSYFGDKTASVQFLNTLKGLPNVDAKLAQNAQKVLDAYALFDTYQDGKPEFLAALIAKQFLSFGELDLAIGKLEYVLNKTPDYTDVSTLLGSAYLIKGNYEKAITIFTNSLPNERPEVYYWLGIAHFYQQNYSKAIAAFQLSLDKGYRPQFKPHEKIADAYVYLNNFTQAVEEYKSAINTSDGQDYIDLYVRPVWLYIDKLKMTEEALTIATQAVGRFPRSAMAYNLLGWSQLGLGQYEQAKVSLDKAVELDPTLAATYLNLGNYYRAQNNPAQAIATYQKAVQYDKQGSIARAAQNLIKSIPVPSSIPSDPALSV
jgi:tetratricopeptide (TPR) repeat protein